MSVVDLDALRFSKAADCSEVTARATLVEAIRRIDAAELDSPNVIVVLLNEYPDGGTAIELMHGGPASTNERIGMLVRSTDLMIHRGN